MATNIIKTDRLVIAVPGTTETTPGADPSEEIGMISHATKFLSPELFDKHFMPYDALYGDGLSYRDSRDTAVRRLIDMILRYNGSELYLIGYSQGAAIVTIALKTMMSKNMADPYDNTGVPWALEKVKGVYLIANPHRQPGMIHGDDPGGEGISFSPEDGWWGDLRDRVMEIAAPGDIIGSTDPDKTFLKRLPMYSIDMNWQDFIGWARSIYDVMIHTNPFTLYPELRKEFGIFTYLSRYFNTAAALHYYITSGVHVRYHEYQPFGSQTAVRAIANDIIDKAMVINTPA